MFILLSKHSTQFIFISTFISFCKPIFVLSFSLLYYVFILSDFFINFINLFLFSTIFYFVISLKNNYFLQSIYFVFYNIFLSFSFLSAYFLSFAIPFNSIIYCFFLMLISLFSIFLLSSFVPSK